jgi:hypothetical protein
LMVSGSINNVPNSDDVIENQDEDSLDRLFVDNFEANVSHDNEAIAPVPKLVNIDKLTTSSSSLPLPELEPQHILVSAR